MLPLLVACPSVDDIPDFNGAVNGTVMYKDQPLEGVEIALSPGGMTFVTKSDGTYFFEDLVSGAYTLTYRKKGYKTVTKNVNISAGTNILVEINMEIDGNLVTADTDILNFGKQSKVMTFNIVNQLDRVVSWEIRQDNLPAWVSFKSLSGDVPANSQNPVSVTVDRSKVKGETDSFSLDIDISTGNALSVKVNVEAGKIPKIEISPIAIGYDYYQMEFIRGENCTRYCLGDDLTADIDIATIMKNGTYYDVDCGIEFNCQRYPGVTHYLYVIPFNEFDQHGEMEVYKISLDEEPEPEVYTELKDIKTPGTYNVKDAVVAYADGRLCVIGDYEDAVPFFYMYFDNTYTSSLPQQGDVLDITCDVISFHNVLEFLNPQFTVTGKKNLEDYEFTGGLSDFFESAIEDGNDMTAYCSSSDPGVRYMYVRGSVVKSGQYYDLMVDGTSIIGNLKASDKSIFSKYIGKTIDVEGLAIGYDGQFLDIIVVGIEEVEMPKPTLESYMGYWNATAYNINKEEWETWDNLYMYSHEDSETGEVRVTFENWMFGYPYYYFGTLGYYDESTGNIILEGNWSTGSYRYKDSDDEYRSYFILFYAEGGIDDNIYYIKPSRSEMATAVLKYTDDQWNDMIFTGDEEYPDENGRVANSVSFEIKNITTGEYEGWYPVYKDITFTRSSNPPAEAAYARSQSGKKPRNCVEIDQSDAPRAFDARRFFVKVPQNH